jgi:SAM-dependent methyltransferase
MKEQDISKGQADSDRIVLAVPPGLEVAAIRIARREHDLRFERLAPGLILSKEPAGDPRAAALLDSAPIWTFGSFRLIRKLKQLDGEGLAASVAALAETVGAVGWEGSAYWLDADPGATHGWARQLLNSDFGLRNNPGDYALTLKVSGDANAVYVLLGPSISVRQRFAYRKADVGISINPVLGACLARLLPRELDGRVIDATCGSGTLLFERLRYSNETSGLGIDISWEAEKAFAANLPDADLGGSPVDFRLGSSASPANWEPCSSVICNLPFGMRVRIHADDLDRLYHDILENAHANLTADGRILLTSSYKRGLEHAADKMADRLKILSKYRAEMGGLFYQIFVFAHV